MLKINPVVNQNYKYQNNSVKQASVNNIDSIKPSQAKTVNFCGIGDVFRQTSKALPEIEVLPNVSSDFVRRITKQIGEFPQKWLSKFRDEGYQVVLSPTFAEAYKSKRVFDPNVLMFEFQNPKGTLGVTYSEGRGGKNFFAFCDKPPYSDRFMTGIVNHEFSHGAINISELDKNPDYLQALKSDIDLIVKERKLDKLTETERKLVSHYFFNNQAYLPVDEIIADSIAWQQKGGGCYGSGLILDTVNPNLIPSLFPNLSSKVRTI